MKDKSINWNNLSKGLCPKCNEILKQEESFLICECDFKIGIEKYKDLIKGKKSKPYLRVINKIKKIKKYNEKLNSGVFTQNREIKQNLKRMLHKGKITREYYEKKLATL